MKSFIIISIGIFWLWMVNPTYDQLQHPFWPMFNIFIGCSLIILGVLNMFAREMDKYSG